MNLKVAYTNKSVWPVDWSHSLYDNSAYRGAIQIRRYRECDEKSFNNYS